jgi:histidinol-phosphate/aromatic aminotransferase/cobyric acid decarboxylase-like protein
MSKDFGIAGIRAGYAVMAKSRIDLMLQNGFLWNSNGLSEYFFRLYTRQDFANDYDKVRVRYIKETIDFIEKLKEIPGIKVYPGKANFVMIELLIPGLTSFDFVTALLVKHGIYVRTCNDKIGLEGEFIRMASRTAEENDYMVKSMKELLSDL